MQLCLAVPQKRRLFMLRSYGNGGKRHCLFRGNAFPTPPNFSRRKLQGGSAAFAVFEVLQVFVHEHAAVRQVAGLWLLARDRKYENRGLRAAIVQPLSRKDRKGLAVDDELQGRFGLQGRQQESQVTTSTILRFDFLSPKNGSSSLWSQCSYRPTGVTATVSKIVMSLTRQALTTDGTFMNKLFYKPDSMIAREEDTEQILCKENRSSAATSVRMLKV